MNGPDDWGYQFFFVCRVCNMWSLHYGNVAPLWLKSSLDEVLAVLLDHQVDEHPDEHAWECMSLHTRAFRRAS